MLAVTLTCKSPVPVRLPSDTWKRTVPAVAVQEVVTMALIVPLVFVMLAGPMIYAVTNFGTLFRLRQMLYVIAAILPVTLAERVSKLGS